MMPHRQKIKKTALVQAVDLLARQEQSVHKLKEKLEQRGYGAEEIETAVARLQERHYLDDEAVCSRQFTYFYEDSRLSIRQICAKLMQRGFDTSLVKSCVPQECFEREKRAALRCLYIKFKPTAEPIKMLQYLYGRGFDQHAMRAAVDEFMLENEEKD